MRSGSIGFPVMPVHVGIVTRTFAAASMTLWLSLGRGLGESRERQDALSARSERTMAQFSIGYLPAANRMKAPSDDHRGKAAPTSPDTSVWAVPPLEGTRKRLPSVDRGA
jgi:hypothetical protein